MLNPEYVEYNEELRGFKIGFTDSEGDEALEIILKEEDTYHLNALIVSAKSKRQEKQKNNWGK